MGNDSSQARPAVAVRILAALLILYLCSSCVSSTAGNKNGSSSLPVISIMAPLHFPHPPSQEIIAQVEALAKVKLDINWVPDGIYTDKMNTALSTNSLKKATFVKHTDYIFVKNAIRSGSFWEIGSYLERFPNLRHLDAGILEQAAIDGKIFGLYTERPSSRQGIIIREDWLEALKLGKPETLEDLYEVIKQFTLGDPDGNGQQDTVGLADRNDLVFGAFKTLSSYFGTPNNWGIVDKKVIPEFETAPYLETMNFMKRLYDEKLMNADFAVTSKDMQRDQIIRGAAGVYIGSMTDVQRLSDEAKQLNPKARFTLVNRIQGPGGGYHIWSIPNYNGLYLFSKKAIRTEEELLEQLAFFDRTMDKELANLMRYGIEGKHYTLNGEKVQLPEATSQLRVTEVNALYPLMIADLSNPNLLKVAEKESMWELAERLSADNDKFIVKDPTIGLESKTYDEKSMELNKIISDATYKYILGQISADGFYQEVDRWKRSGGSQMMAEYTDAYFKRE